MSDNAAMPIACSAESRQTAHMWVVITGATQLGLMLSGAAGTVT